MIGRLLERARSALRMRDWLHMLVHLGRRCPR